MDESEYLPLSWLSQISYCPRRAGLLLNERVWEESSDTAKGRAEHERVHTQRIEKRGDCVKLYEFTVYSDLLELLGKCDCIEANKSENGCTFRQLIFQYNYIRLNINMELSGMKRNIKFSFVHRRCAWKKCLITEVPEGALFFISSHRRLEIVLDESLRRRHEN